MGDGRIEGELRLGLIGIMIRLEWELRLKIGLSQLLELRVGLMSGICVTIWNRVLVSFTATLENAVKFSQRLDED